MILYDISVQYIQPSCTTSLSTRHSAPVVGPPAEEQSEEERNDGGAPHGLAWTEGAGALRTGWKLIGVGVLTRDDVRGGAGLQVEGRLAL